MRHPETCLRFFILTSILCLLTACGKSHRTSDAAPAQANTALKEQKPANLVVLGPDAPELKHLSIEPVRAVEVPADEVVAPARIEANPNRVAHAVLPAPGRVIRVTAKLGDLVSQGQPLVTIEGPSVGEAETAFIQAEASVRQAEVAITKADADLSREADLYEHQAVAKKEMLAAQTTLALARPSLEQARSAREQARRLEMLGLKPGQLHQHDHGGSADLWESSGNQRRGR